MPFEETAAEGAEPEVVESDARVAEGAGADAVDTVDEAPAEAVVAEGEPEAPADEPQAEAAEALAGLEARLAGYTPLRKQSLFGRLFDTYVGAAGVLICAFWIFAAIFAAIFIWNEFLVGLYIVNSQALKTIPLGAAGLISAQRPIDWNIAATVGVVTIIPIFFFSLFVQRSVYFREFRLLLVFPEKEVHAASERFMGFIAGDASKGRVHIDDRIFRLGCIGYHDTVAA